MRERRRGFDRRSPSRLDRVLYRVAAGLPVAIGLAAVFALLNLVDLLATAAALEQGAVELNPVMRALLGSGAGGALILKVAVTAAAVGGFLAGRRYRCVVMGMLFVTSVLAVVAAYHGLNLAVAA